MEFKNKNRKGINFRYQNQFPFACSEALQHDSSKNLNLIKSYAVDPKDYLLQNFYLERKTFHENKTHLRCDVLLFTRTTLYSSFAPLSTDASIFANHS